jgi:hypothetical protein
MHQAQVEKKLEAAAQDLIRQGVPVQRRRLLEAAGMSVFGGIKYEALQWQ